MRYGTATVRGRVLIVAVDLSLRALLRKALTSAGFSVLAAATIPDAETLLEIYTEEIRLVIVDIAMKARGLDIASQLSASRPSQEVLYISHSVDMLLVDAIHSVKPEAVLAAPFTARELVARVRRLAA